MNGRIDVVKHMYERFNARDIDGVLGALADDVAWANGMDGGYVNGHDAVRTYWTRQWAMVIPNVTPLSFVDAPDGSIVVQVQQVIRDLEGNALHGQTHGLHDKVVGHVFRFHDAKVIRFDIEDVP